MGSEFYVLLDFLSHLFVYHHSGPSGEWEGGTSSVVSRSHVTNNLSCCQAEVAVKKHLGGAATLA